MSLLIAVLLSSCTAERFTVSPASIQQRVDSAARANGITAKKLTFKGPVTFTTQVGTGNVATPTATDNTKAGQRAAAAAIGAGSVAAATEKGSPWYVYGLLVVLLIGAGFLLRSKLSL